MNQHNRAARLCRLFFSTLYISSFTFGGGFVIVTLMKKKFVDELHWITEEEMLDMTALAESADLEFGGMHYSYGPDGKLYDLDKYHWVHCETVAAAAGLALRTGQERFRQDYDRLWRYSWRHLVDHEYGCWFRILSPAGVIHSGARLRTSRAAGNSRVRITLESSSSA